MKRAFIIMVTCLAAALFLIPAYAETSGTETVYVLCNPSTYVNIRETPSKKGFCGGRAYCGDDFRTDGKEKNGFLHILSVTEMGEGWISKGFIVYSEPEKCGENEKWVVDSNGRVAARSTIGGKRNRWLRNGTEITVYYVAEIAVTNYGFIDSRYLCHVSDGLFLQ